MNIFYLTSMIIFISLVLSCHWLCVLLVYNLIVVVICCYGVGKNTRASSGVRRYRQVEKTKHSCDCVTSVSAYMHLIKWKYELDVLVFDEK